MYSNLLYNWVSILVTEIFRVEIENNQIHFIHSLINIELKRLQFLNIRADKAFVT